MIEDGQRAYGGRAQHVSTGAGDALGRRLGRRMYRFGRSRRLGGHGLGFLPGCTRTACYLRHTVAPCGRNVAKTSGLSQEGNVQFGQKSRIWAVGKGTYDEDHRRKFCAARLTSMVRFVSAFYLSPRTEVDIAAACPRREDSQWTRTRCLVIRPRKATAGGRLKLPSYRRSPPGNSKIYNSDLRKVGYRRSHARTIRRRRAGRRSAQFCCTDRASRTAAWRWPDREGRRWRKNTCFPIGPRTIGSWHPTSLPPTSSSSTRCKAFRSLPRA